jgi:hypothetical protein
MEEFMAFLKKIFRKFANLGANNIKPIFETVFLALGAFL